MVDSAPGDFHPLHFLVVFPLALVARILSDQNALTLLMFADHFPNVKLDLGIFDCAKIGLEQCLHVDLFVVGAVLGKEVR